MNGFVGSAAGVGKAENVFLTGGVSKSITKHVIFYKYTSIYLTVKLLRNVISEDISEAELLVSVGRSFDG